MDSTQQHDPAEQATVTADLEREGLAEQAAERPTAREQLRAAAHRLNTAHQKASTEPCQGMPPGYASPCGIIVSPHGPHDVPVSIPLQSAAVSKRVDDLDPEPRDLNFLIGWLISTDPAAVADALDGLAVYRDRPACNRFHAHQPHGTCRGITLERAYSAQESE